MLYSFSLLYNVFRSIFNSCAALLLLFPVWRNASNICSFSVSSLRNDMLVVQVVVVSSKSVPNSSNEQQSIPVPKPHQLKWHEAEMGAVFHYDLHVFDGIRYGQGNNRINPIEDYNIFNPTELNTDQWVRFVWC